MHRFLFALLALTYVALAAPALELKKGDHVAIVGGGFADRMQHSCYFEAFLHQAHREHELVIRNLAAAGDEVTTWHRSQDFGSQDEWLKRVEANVILAFWGFNESFQGADGLTKFKDDLSTWIDGKRGQTFGKEAPRIALFSPVAAEETGNPDLPRVAPLNANLALYAKAVKEVAAEKELPFVDLYQHSLQIYERTETQLTVNGLHLIDDGYNLLSGLLAKDLCQSTLSLLDRRIVNAVRDKNERWFSRYRTVDGYNVYGGRSKRVYANVSNFKVMQEEMRQRDAQTANREARIWASARGKDFSVKDDNLPAVTETPTNLPDHRIAPYPDPEEAIGEMKIHSGMEVNLFASEKEFPELANPVQMAWDTKNRLWVAAWPTYPAATPTDKVLDKLLVFEDTDWDGKADKMTTFADGLNSPTGFQFYKDGVLVMQSPDLIWLRDTDGDGRADWSQRMLNGIDSADTHHTTNAMAYDPGGGIYLSDGVFHRTQVETADGPKRNVDGSIYRYNPRTGEFDWFMAHGFANPHGKAFDRWGNSFITDATGNVNYYGDAASGHTTDGRKHARLKEFWKRPSRPCPATEILSSAHFPEEFQGNFLNANVISFQGIFRVGVTYEGSGPKGETLEHLVSTDPKDNQHFRPICMSNGPDGALYFCDWTQTIIGHLQHHIRDPHRDHQHGRIYRITYEGRDLATPPKISGEPINNLLDHLASPVNGTRLLAKIELDTRPTENVIAAAAERLKRPSLSEHEKMELLWLHQWHNVVNEALLDTVLASPTPEARAAAGRVLCYWRKRVSNPLDKLHALCTDDHPRVRLEGIRMASFYSGEEAVQATNAALASLAHPTDDYLDYILKETMQQLETWWRPALVEGRIAPNNLPGATYLLTTVNNRELLVMPRIPAVLNAWLTRPGVPELKRLDALAELTKSGDTTGAQLLLGALESKQPGIATADLGRLLTRQPAADLKPLRERLTKLGTTPAALASIMIADGSIDELWNAAQSDEVALANVLNAIPSIADAALRATAHDRVSAVLTQLPEPLASKLTDTSATQGRFVRVSLPKKGILTLAEVEVMSGNANIATRGTATQSSVASSGLPQRAIDGNTAGSYGANTSTHTKEPDNDPWWEVDLGGSYPIEAITIWNRTDGNLGRRLNRFNLTVLDDTRRTVFESKENRAPRPSATFEVGPGDPKGTIQRAAIAALVSTNDNPNATFIQLCELIDNDESLTEAARGLRKIHRDSWNATAAGIAAKAMYTWAKAVPTEGRTAQDFIENVQVATELASYLPHEEVDTIRTALQELGVSVIVLRTVHEQLRYDTNHITVEADKPFEIVFENDDLMPHNLIICQKGAKEALGTAALTMTPDQLDSKGRAYVPESNQIIAATQMLEAGEKARLTIEGLAPGEYEYVCTFPGHWSVMNGKLNVREK
ncbi:MAG: plastocyanin/azurin family copper-binding protein [Verrucomicrobiales bacterium]|nr:plastocyanin/azurin family copper-binding protein [Verrucomicrobiales bacterium]